MDVIVRTTIRQALREATKATNWKIEAFAHALGRIKNG
jgi:hypothetical protein